MQKWILLALLAQAAVGPSIAHAEFAQPDSQKSSSTYFTDPKLIAWLDRTTQRGRQAQAACNAELSRVGLPVLTATALSSDPDFSREIAALDQGLLILRTKCVDYNTQSLEALVRDLRSLNLQKDEERVVEEGAVSGFQSGAKTALDSLSSFMEETEDFLRFAHSSGAKWRGPGQGFLYPTDADAAKGNELSAKAAASRGALLDAGKTIEAALQNPNVRRAP